MEQQLIIMIMILNIFEEVDSLQNILIFSVVKKRKSELISLATELE